MELSDIKKVGVVGAGTMGFGIALNFALGGYPVMMSDLSSEHLEQSMRQVRAALDLFV
jgi:3-hydroxybutyryl-CoA dehydrogenase